MKWFWLERFPPEPLQSAGGERGQFRAPVMASVCLKSLSRESHSGEPAGFPGPRQERFLWIVTAPTPGGTGRWKTVSAAIAGAAKAALDAVFGESLTSCLAHVRSLPGGVRLGAL